jgi:hypothetical protein
MLVPIINIISFLSRTVIYDRIKFNIIVGVIYIVLSHIIFIILYFIWNRKYPKKIKINRKQGQIKQRKSIKFFEIKDIDIKGEYLDILGILNCGFRFGTTYLRITTKNNEILEYETCIFWFTYKKLLKVIGCKKQKDD